MYSYIKGQLAEIEEDKIVVEAGGIGYNIYTTGQTFQYLPPVGENVKVYTYLHLREDIMMLYGFLSKDELKVFKLLLGVNGIGPKGALAILSVMTTDDLRFAVLGDDAKAIAKAPGIGMKTAKKLILELKDKFTLEEAFEKKLENGASGAEPGAVVESDAKTEAIQALTALGYANSDALRAVRRAEITEDMDTETILKLALKQLAFL